MRDELILTKIKDAVKILDDIDEMIKSQSLELQTIDYKLSDLYHLIENNELSDEASINIVKAIHNLRKQRRSLNNEFEIENTYRQHKSKLTGNETRQFLANEIFKTTKRLNQEYKNRVLTDEDIQNIIEPKKKKVGRPRKVQV